jgi:hypothetical protein
MLGGKVQGLSQFFVEKGGLSGPGVRGMGIWDALGGDLVARREMGIARAGGWHIFLGW